MKTIEEKAKAYDKALERAKKELDVCGSQDCDAARQIFRLFPELAESEDEKIRKAIIEFFELEDDNTTYSFVPKKDIITWLEKQGEQKPFDYENATIAQKDFAPKTTQKIKPRFKIGDWICNGGGNPCKVNDVFGNYYKLCLIEDYKYNKPISDIDTNYHLWSITDAKDGDVLVDVYGNIGIYKKCVYYEWTSYCSLGCNGGFQNFLVPHENDKTRPATKEQRDLLFKKMHEEGYEWDANKKELKKIETKGGEE